MHVRFAEVVLFLLLIWLLPGMTPQAGDSATIRATATVENPVGLEMLILSETDIESEIEMKFRCPGGGNMLLQIRTDRSDLASIVPITPSDDTGRAFNIMSVSGESLRKGDSLIVTVVYTGI
jgi:hypothetical protein